MWFSSFQCLCHGKVLCNRNDELIDKCSFIKSYAWKKLCGTGQGMKWEALSHGQWMQMALGLLWNVWAFCERRKGRKVRDSWPTTHACSWYFNYSHILLYNLFQRFYILAKDKVTLQKMFMVTQLLPVVFRQAQELCSGPCPNRCPGMESFIILSLALTSTEFPKTLNFNQE